MSALTAAKTVVPAAVSIAVQGDRLDRQECISHTHPSFDDTGVNCDTWTCSPFTSRRHPTLSCCVTPIDRLEALGMLNGTLLQFAGDSTSGRAARQLSAFLLQHPFEQVRDHFGFHHVLHSGEAGTTMTLRFRWMPTADELDENVLKLTASMNSSVADWAPVRVPPGTPNLTADMLPQPVAQRRVLILTLSSHDVAFKAWNWMTIGERVLDQAVRDKLRVVAAPV